MCTWTSVANYKHHVWTCWSDSVNSGPLPLGGGLMSASPCWLELSDCPDSSRQHTGKETTGHNVVFTFDHFETRSVKIKSQLSQRWWLTCERESTRPAVYAMQPLYMWPFTRLCVCVCDRPSCSHTVLPPLHSQGVRTYSVLAASNHASYHPP